MPATDLLTYLLMRFSTSWFAHPCAQNKRKQIRVTHR